MIAQFDNPLDRVTVAAPCPADWSRMHGGERVRFCGQCSLNVYNLSAMSKREAETLITQAEGRLCVRFYRRADGTILTNNCPVGWRALKRRVTKIASGVFTTIVSFLTGVGVFAGAEKLNQWGSGSDAHAFGGVSFEVDKTPRDIPVGGMMVVAEDEWVKGRAFMQTKDGKRLNPVGAKGNKQGR